jgi:pimeloyl-ACP methyl ester carboxylesterase
MATYVVIHGAAVDSWYWRPLAAELRVRGHDVVAPDMPIADDSAGLAEYTDAVIDAIGDRTDLIVVAHSLGGFVGPLVCERVPVDLLVMLHAQIPAPGESPGDWWTNSGYGEARATHDADGATPSQDDTLAFALHDTPNELATELMTKHQVDQSGAPFEQPWPLDAWPDVPTKVLLSRGDHFFPVEFLRTLAKDRLNISADEMDGDHCPMLGHPTELAERLEAYRLDVIKP